MSDQDGAANTISERSDQSGLKLRVLLGTDRIVLTAVLGLLVFLSFVALVGVLEPPPVVEQLQGSSVIETLFTTMLSAVALVTTLTVTIGQVVLSQENGPLGDQHSRMSDAMNVRSFVGDVIGEPSPADPSAFLRVLVGAAEERARTLRETAAGSGDGQFEADVDELVTSILDNAETVESQLSGQTFGTYAVVSAALDFNYGQKIYEVERITAEHAAVIDADERERLEDLKAALTLFAPAREHIKTLFFQWELVNLSRQILYVSVPALVVAGVMVAVVEPASFPGSTVGIENILWIVAGAFTLTLLPFLLLVSYILRLVTLAQQTLAIGPLILRESTE